LRIYLLKNIKEIINDSMYYELKTFIFVEKYWTQNSVLCLKTLLQNLSLIAAPSVVARHIAPS